ncbi:MAG: hypothetical protein DMD81_17590 [Candidatus Rokuibacteriota bacterium]|nr:MAG: hypothetical protein DMD81_17590 [Candidatus Rokubacteria bacterium]
MQGQVTFVTLVVVACAVAAAVTGSASAQTEVPGQAVVVEGTIAMAVEDDFRSGRATRRYLLQPSGSSAPYDLELTPRQANSVQPGMRVRVTGRLHGSVLTADQTDQSVVILDAPASGVSNQAR